MWHRDLAWARLRHCFWEWRSQALPPGLVPSSSSEGGGPPPLVVRDLVSSSGSSAGARPSEGGARPRLAGLVTVVSAPRRRVRAAVMAASARAATGAAAAKHAVVALPSQLPTFSEESGGQWMMVSLLMLFAALFATACTLIYLVGVAPEAVRRRRTVGTQTQPTIVLYEDSAVITALYGDRWHTHRCEGLVRARTVRHWNGLCAYCLEKRRTSIDAIPTPSGQEL